jgi:4-amino-4-deoxy-L-arabinose transferase-like glycosyltransferase
MWAKMQLQPILAGQMAAEGIVSRILRQIVQIPDSSRALPVLLLFSAVLMGALFFARLKADLNFDGEIYLSAAIKFESGMYMEGMVIYQMPFYPYLIVLMHRIIPNWVLAGRLISYMFMVMAVIPLYLLSRDLFNHRAAFWACLTFALLPETLLNSNSVLRDPGFFFFFAWSVYYAQKVLQSNRLIHLAFSAFFSVSSTLFRIEGLLVFPVVFLFLIGSYVAKGMHAKDHIKLWLVWGGLFTALIVIIYVGAEWQGIKLNRYGDWLAYSNSFKDQSFLESYHRVSNQLQQMQDASLKRDVGQHFAETARELIWLIYLIGMLQMFVAVILFVNTIPMIWGLILTRYTDRHVFVLISTICLFVFIYGFFVRHDLLIKRYLFMPAALLCPWVGLGISRILESIKLRTHPKLLAAFVILTVFALPAAEFDKYFKNRDDLKSQAASWIAKQSGLKDLKIVFSDQVLKFHADMEKNIHNDKTTILHQDHSDKDFSKIARFAADNKLDAIAIYSRIDRKNDVSDFASYKEIKEFADSNKFIKIFVSMEQF